MPNDRLLADMASAYMSHTWGGNILLPGPGAGQVHHSTSDMRSTNLNSMQRTPTYPMANNDRFFTVGGAGNTGCVGYGNGNSNADPSPSTVLNTTGNIPKRNSGNGNDSSENLNINTSTIESILQPSSVLNVPDIDFTSSIPSLKQTFFTLSQGPKFNNSGVTSDNINVNATSGASVGNGGLGISKSTYNNGTDSNYGNALYGDMNNTNNNNSANTSNSIFGNSINTSPQQDNNVSNSRSGYEVAGITGGGSNKDANVSIGVSGSGTVSGIDTGSINESGLGNPVQLLFATNLTPTGVPNLFSSGSALSNNVDDNSDGLATIAGNDAENNNNTHTQNHDHSHNGPNSGLLSNVVIPTESPVTTATAMETQTNSGMNQNPNADDLILNLLELDPLSMSGIYWNEQ